MGICLRSGEGLVQVLKEDSSEEDYSCHDHRDAFRTASRPAPVAEAPAPAPVVEEAAEPETISGTLTYEGYSLTYDAVPGSATVYYPDFITDEEIDAFFAMAFVSHSDYLAGVYYDIVEPGVMNVTFPEDVTVADATAVVDMLLVDLQSFIG